MKKLIIAAIIITVIATAGGSIVKKMKTALDNRNARIEAIFNN